MKPLTELGIGLFLIQLVCAKIEIRNVTDQSVAKILLGEAKISRGRTKMIININLSRIENITNQIKTNLEPNFNKSELGQILQVEITKLEEKLGRISLKPNRIKRWDYWGYAWKWISGSPDADDLQYIEESLDSLNDNNKKQMNINKDIENKLNEIVETLNEVANPETTNITNNPFKLISTLFNIKTLNEQLDNILGAIISRKINNKLLTRNEVENIKNIMEEQGVKTEIMEQALEFVTTTIGISKSHILYILNIPKLNKETYELVHVQPVIHNNERVKIPGKLYVKGEKEIYWTKDECKTIGKYFVCNQENLNSIGKNKCIFNILQNRNSSCLHETVTKYNKVEEIDPSTLMLNNVRTTIKNPHDKTIRNLTGSFIIRYNNCTISVFKKKYTNNFHKTIELSLVMPSKENNVFKTNHTRIKKMVIDQLKETNTKKPQTRNLNESLILILVIVICFVILLRR